MEIDLMTFAVVMACLAVAVVMVCVVMAVSEGWNISHRGWTQGHRQNHSLRRRPSA